MRTSSSIHKLPVRNLIPRAPVCSRSYCKSPSISESGTQQYSTLKRTQSYDTARYPYSRHPPLSHARASIPPLDHSRAFYCLLPPTQAQLILIMRMHGRDFCILYTRPRVRFLNRGIYKNQRRLRHIVRTVVKASPFIRVRGATTATIL